MSISHRTNRLKLVGTPAVKKLQNGRDQITVNCTTMNSRVDWYSSNKDSIFPDFGSLQSAEMSIDGLAPRTGEAYTDMRLVSVESDTNREGTYIVTLVYQTLGNAFVQIKDDNTDYELNGLRRVTRTSIAEAGTDVPDDDKDIGVDYIDHQVDAETAVRCFLSSYKVNDTDSYREFERTYIQAGELSRDIRSVGRGVQQTTHQFLVTEGSTTGDIISRNTDNFLGLNRITVSVISRPDGATLTNSDGSAKLSYSEQQLVPFTFPGVVDLQSKESHVFPTVRSPVQSKVKADVYTYYQESSDIGDGDFTTQSALGLWNPSEWCQKISTIEAREKQSAYFNAQGLRGCRTRSSFKLSGSLYDSLSNDLKYNVASTEIQLNNLELEETVEVSNGKSVFKEILKYTRDSTRRVDYNVGGSGVNIIQTASTLASGEFTIKLEWDGSQWVLSGTNIIIDGQPTHSGTGDGTYVFSQEAGGYLDEYANKSGSTTTTFFTSTNGASEPEDADWPSGVTATGVSDNEELSVMSTSERSSGTDEFSAFTSFIEGREVPAGATGQIRIFGGPPNPLGKVYTLDVDLEKAFTKIDGTDVYRKTIVVATCTPA
jgi:hypothetical protein